MTLRLTNLSKNLENNSFLLFLTQNDRQKFSPNFLQIWYFLLFWPSTSTQVFLYPLLLAFKCIPHAKFEKSPLIMPVSLFFHNTGPLVITVYGYILIVIRHIWFKLVIGNSMNPNDPFLLIVPGDLRLLEIIVYEQFLCFFTALDL